MRSLRLDSFNANASAVTNATFAGLNSIREIRMNPELFVDFKSFLNVKANLRPLVDRSKLGVTYYLSIGVVYSKVNYSDLDCFLMLESIRSNIQVNLENDAMMKKALSYCGRYTLNELLDLLSFY